MHLTSIFLTGRGNRKRGFSMIELIVVITIFTTLSVAFLMNYNSTSARLTTDNFAFTVIQRIRETQSYAMSVKATADGFPLGYGLRIENPTTFIVFADQSSPSPNNAYDAGTGECGTPTTECVSRLTFPQGFAISAIQATPLGGGTAVPAYVDMVYRRPNPDATMFGLVSGTRVGLGDVTFTVQGPKGFTKQIVMSTTGQVSLR